MSLMIEDTDFYRFVWDNTVFTEPEPEPEPDDGIPAPEPFEPEGSEE